MSSNRVSRSALAQAVAEAVSAVPGVARLSPGGVVEVATQFAGGKVVGILLTPTAVRVHVVIDRVPVPLVAAAVSQAARRALDRLADSRAVDVVVDDIVLGAMESEARS